jgi:hypothetical protein
MPILCVLGKQNMAGERKSIAGGRGRIYESLVGPQGLNLGPTDYEFKHGGGQSREVEMKEIKSMPKRSVLPCCSLRFLLHCPCRPAPKLIFRPARQSASDKNYFTETEIHQAKGNG